MDDTAVVGVAQVMSCITHGRECVIVQERRCSARPK